MELIESEKRSTREYMEFAEPHLSSHPISAYYLQGGKPTALRISDVQSWHQFKNSFWGEQMNRLWGVNRMVSLPAIIEGAVASANAITRRGKDFNERDRLVLNLLHPHFALVRKRLKRKGTLATRSLKPLDAYALSPRESEVARWLSKGKSNPEIAAILDMKVRTVEKHMERVLAKLHVENRTAAAVVVAESREWAKLSP